jgi:hypothetical protein
MFSNIAEEGHSLVPKNSIEICYSVFIKISFRNLPSVCFQQLRVEVKRVEGRKGGMEGWRKRGTKKGRKGR